MKRLFLALAAVAAIAGCTRNPESLPPAKLETVAYQNEGPTSLTLYTVVNRRSGRGGHTALGVNASERVLFDPAGSFEATGVVRSGDVLYGFSPAVEEVYSSMHARSTYFVTKLTVPVDPQVAEMALQRVKQNGAVAAAHCAQSTSTILKTLPGFTDIEATYYPRNLESQFQNRAGIRASEIVEDD